MTYNTYYTENSAGDVVWVITYVTGLPTGDGTSVTAYPVYDQPNLLALAPVLIPANVFGLSSVSAEVQALLQLYSYDGLAAPVITQTSADYVQPALSGSQDVFVADTEGFYAGQSILIVGGGYYMVIDVVSSTELFLQYIGGGAATGTTITSGANVSFGTVLYEG